MEKLKEVVCDTLEKRGILGKIRVGSSVDPCSLADRCALNRRSSDLTSFRRSMRKTGLQEDLESAAARIHLSVALRVIDTCK